MFSRRFARMFHIASSRSSSGSLSLAKSPSPDVTGAGTQRQNNRQSGIRFSFADASFEVTAICFGHEPRIIYEQNEFRRCEMASRFFVARNSSARSFCGLENVVPWLRRVKQFKPAAVDQGRWIRFKRLADQPVEHFGANPLPRRMLDFLDYGKKPIDIFAGGRRCN